MKDLATIIAIAIGFPVLLLAILSPLAIISGKRLRFASNFTSLTFAQIADFAIAREDRAEAIGQFFEWKHNVHLELLKAVVAFLLANLGLLLKFSLDPTDESVRLFRLAVDLDLITTMIAGLIGTLIAIGWLMLRLRRIPLEYSTAVRILGLLR